MNETEIPVSENANPDAVKGEPASTTGFLGRGKLIPSNTTGSSDVFSSGKTETNGMLAESTKDKESVVPCNKIPGPAP